MWPLRWSGCCWRTLDELMPWGLNSIEPSICIAGRQSAVCLSLISWKVCDSLEFMPAVYSLEVKDEVLTYYDLAMPISLRIRCSDFYLFWEISMHRAKQSTIICWILTLASILNALYNSEIREGLNERLWVSNIESCWFCCVLWEPSSSSWPCTMRQLATKWRMPSLTCQLVCCKYFMAWWANGVGLWF